MGSTGSHSGDTPGGFYIGLVFCSSLQKHINDYWLLNKASNTQLLHRGCSLAVSREVWSPQWTELWSYSQGWCNLEVSLKLKCVTHPLASSYGFWRPRSRPCRRKTWTSCWVDSLPGKAAGRAGWEAAWSWQTSDKLQRLPAHHPASGMKQLQGKGVMEFFEEGDFLSIFEGCDQLQCKCTWKSSMTLW